LLTQTAVIIVLRSNKFPFHNTAPSLPVVLSLIAILLIGFILVIAPGLNPVFSSLTNAYSPIIAWIILVVFSYIIVAQLSKVAYIKLFHS
jgi:Mg2+-importing ATPase